MSFVDFFPGFHWLCSSYGYVWITGVSQGGEDDPERRWLIENYSPRGGPIVLARGYDLTEHPMLFHTFAESPPTEEGILHFAQTYGLLGVEEDCWVSEEARQVGAVFLNRWQKNRANRAAIADMLGKTYFSGERLTTWQREIRSMRCAIAMWQAIQTGDVQWFIDHVIMRVAMTDDHTAAGVEYSLAEEGIYAGASGTLTFPAPAETAADAEQMLKPNEVVRAGWDLLQDLLNHRLSRHTASQMVYAAGERRLRLQVVPKNLLGALWLQLARGVDGNKLYSTCPCGNVFEVSLQATGYRTSRAYCSDACRSKAYRERQLRAHQLATEGMTIEAIANTLDTEIETVRGWLAKTPPSLGTRRRGRPRKHLPN